MFGRLVKVGCREYWVSCCPDTPLHEVLIRAAEIAKREYVPTPTRSFTDCIGD